MFGFVVVLECNGTRVLTPALASISSRDRRCLCFSTYSLPAFASTPPTRSDVTETKLAASEECLVPLWMRRGS